MVFFFFFVTMICAILLKREGKNIATQLRKVENKNNAVILKSEKTRKVHKDE